MDELKAECAKQIKLANAANKKAESTDAVNQTLRNEINQLAASISTLRLTMSVGAAQNTFTFAPSTTQIVQNVPAAPNEPGSHLESTQSPSVGVPSEYGTADRDSMDDQESDLEIEGPAGPPPPYTRATSLMTVKQMKKKRKSITRNAISSRQVLEAPATGGRKRSGSGGSIGKYKGGRSWDNDYDSRSVGSDDRQKGKGRKFRSVSMSTKGSSSKSKKTKMEIESAVPEIVC